MKKVLAGRGAVDYYLAQTRRGLADYYLPERSERACDDEGGAGHSAPGSAWWGGGAARLELSGEVQRRQLAPLYGEGARPDGGYLGRRFRLPEQAVAVRAAAIDAAGELDDPYERWLAQHEVRRGGGQASVAAWDCTFSPVKSVSLLWAAGDQRLQRQVWGALLAAVDAGLGYLQEHAAYVRAGRNGVRVHETSGLVVARMNEWTSRDGDMQLHTHCLVLNRAETSDDGAWRALDGRALLTARTGAGAVYNRVLEAELSRRLEVAWRDRPDGLRELDGVNDDLIEAFSTRRRAITTRLAELAAAYERKYGIVPRRAVLSKMAQDATLATRASKREVEPDEALARWEATARRQGRALAALPGQVVGRARKGRSHHAAGDGEVADVLERLAASGRATFTRHDLLRAALDVLPIGDGPAPDLQARAERFADRTVAHPELLSVTAPDVLDVPDLLRRRDGSSLYERPGRQRWALGSTLDQEAWLLEVATEHRGGPVPDGLVDTAVAGHRLGDDQGQAVRELLGSDQRIGLLVGPAGAGKTRTVRAIVDAWQSTGRDVVGLTVSQAAADVLAAEGLVRAENTAKWLYETRRCRWQLPHGALVLVDEASMVSTTELVELVDQARRAGGKVVLVGDPAQLAAIHIGGGFDLLADRVGASYLHEVRRFTGPWERAASLQLRRRDPAALAEYAMRGRIHAGTLGHVEHELFDAWRAEALGTDQRGDRQTVLMIVGTNEQAAVMGERARNALVAADVVDTGPTVRLRDNVASSGDHLVTRRNDRRLATSGGGWVVNGDVWTVLEVHDDGAASVRRHEDDATITLPGGYLAEHAHLGYATTAHRAQGMTVDRCHALVTADASHEQLYVSATRGRDGNHLWVALDSDHDLVRDAADLPEPEQLLSRVLERRDADRLSAHQVIADSQTEMTSLARLGAVYEDTARRATDQWLDQALARRGLVDVAGDRQWPSLVAKVRELALTGHDLERLVDDAVHLRPIDDAHSTAGVLHWRLDGIVGSAPVGRHRGPLGALPPVEGPEADLARQAGELMQQRWRELRAQLRTTSQTPSWAGPLGPRPDSPADRSAWLTATTAVAAYRERYEVADHLTLLGPRPAEIRADARAAWDHARLQTDRFRARRLEHLTDYDLAELDRRQRDIVATRPRFDPAELERARRALDRANRAWRTTSRQHRPDASPVRDEARRNVDRLERQGEAHRRWRRAATIAEATSRQISLVQQRRSARTLQR